MRLKKELETAIRDLAGRYEVSVSEVVRMALEEKLAREQTAGNAYALGVELFGRYSSGDTDRSKRVETRLKEKLRARHSR